MNNRHAAAQAAVEPLTCNELGVCQAKRPRCTGCTAGKPPSYPFAPGTIAGGPRRPRTKWVFGPVLRSASLLDFLGAVALVAACAFLAGWLL